MNWNDDGILLHARSLGETSSVATIFTLAHGKHAGLVRGGSSLRNRSILQMGNTVRCSWKARLEENLGTFAVELEYATASHLLTERVKLAGMASACSLVYVLLPEREVYAALFITLRKLLGKIESDFYWIKEYISWERFLLAELGYGLSLESCAVTGKSQDLAWVSPKTGGAVSTFPGTPYASRLLPLPEFLVRESEAASTDLLDGFRLTGYFLEKAARSSGCRLPSARSHFIDTFSRMPTTYCVNTEV